MHPYRCQVCGEVYLGAVPSDRCPFCGAAGSEMKKASLWYDRGKVKMSKKIYEDCRKALELELNNAAFYKCALERASNQISQAIFKRLCKQELEHAQLLAKVMGISLPEVPKGRCKKSDAANFIEAHDHEDTALNFYLQVAAEADNAGEQEISYIFHHLSEIETEHLVLTNIYK